MLKRCTALSLALGLVIAQVPQANAEVKLTTDSRVATNGMGPVLTGMTLAEAEKASGLKFQVEAAGNGDCRHMKAQRGIKDVSFMVNDGAIAVVYVMNPEVKTLRGAKLGDSEERIRSLYSGQLVRGESVSGRTKVLQFVPKDAEDKNYRIVFSFGNGKLVSYRAGRLPEVGWIEGCF